MLCPHCRPALLSSSPCAPARCPHNSKPKPPPLHPKMSYYFAPSSWTKSGRPKSGAVYHVVPTCGSLAKCRPTECTDADVIASYDCRACSKCRVATPKAEVAAGTAPAADEVLVTLQCPTVDTCVPLSSHGEYSKEASFVFATGKSRREIAKSGCLHFHPQCAYDNAASGDEVIARLSFPDITSALLYVLVTFGEDVCADCLPN